MGKSKEFDLGVILTLTTKRLYTDLENIYEVLQFLTGDEIVTNDLSSELTRAQKYVLSLYPELKEVGQHTILNSTEEYLDFINEQKKIYGDTLALSPIPRKFVDPIEEVYGMLFEKKK